MSAPQPNNAPPPAESASEPEISDDARDFRDSIEHMIYSLGREGYIHALEVLFERSDLVLNSRYCAEHTVRRIREILSDAMPESSSEEESAENG